MLLPAACGGSILQPARGRTRVALPDVNELRLALSPPQLSIFDSPQRNLLLCCGRRFGKTYTALTRLSTWGCMKPGGNFWYVTTTYKAAKRIAWKALRKMVPPALITSVNHSELTITLYNEATLTLMGADNPDSLRGDSLSGCIIDEAAFVSPDAWYEVISPMLSDQEGPCWQLTTPRGFNHFHELWESVEGDPDWARYSYTTLDGGRVSAAEIDRARAHLDPRTYRQEYLASFESAAGRVYPDFDGDNISGEIEDNGGHVYVGLDFNVSIMAGVVCSMLPGQRLAQWDEISMPNSNTDEVGAYLAERFKGRRVIVYPDPTGSARKTSAQAGLTDHRILRNHGLKVISPAAPWAVKDKINSTNALIRTADQTVRYKVHPRCKHTIKALRGVCYKTAAGEDFVIDKKPNIEHWTDGLGYLALSGCNVVKPWQSGGSDFHLI